MTSLTNKNTVLPRAWIYFLRHSKIVLLFVLSSHMISINNENTVLLWRRKCFLLSNSYMEVLVISVRIRIFKWKNYDDNSQGEIISIVDKKNWTLNGPPRPPPPPPAVRFCALVLFDNGMHGNQSITTIDKVYIDWQCKLLIRSSMDKLLAEHFCNPEISWPNRTANIWVG